MQGKFTAVLKKFSVKEWVLLLLIFSMPFERTPSVEIAGFTVKLSLVIGCVLIAINLYNFIAKKQWRYFKKNTLTLLPLLLIAYSLLGYFWVDNTGYWLRANVLLGFCIGLFYAVYLTIKSSSNKDRLFKAIVRVILYSAVVVIAFGLWQWLGNLLNVSSSLTAIRPEYSAERLGLPRMHSVFLEPMWMGSFLLLPLSLILADKTNRIVGSFALRSGLLIAILLAITLSLSRGALLSAGLITVIGLIYNAKGITKLRITPKQVIIFLAVLVVVLGGLAVSINRFSKKGIDTNNNYSKGLGVVTGHLTKFNVFEKQTASKKTSLSERTIGRENGLNTLSASNRTIVVGTGAGQLGLYTQPRAGAEATSWVTLLDFWVSYGLIGLGALLLFLAYVTGAAFKNIRKPRSTYGLYIGLVTLLYLFGFWLQSFTTGSFTIIHVWVWPAVALALLLGQDLNNKKDKPITP